MKTNFSIILAVAMFALTAQRTQAIESVYGSSTSYAIADNSAVGSSSVASYISGATAGAVVAINSITFSIAGGWAGDFTLVLQYTDGTTTLSTTLFSGLLSGTAANGGFDSVTLIAGNTGTSLTSALSTESTASVASGTYVSGIDFSGLTGVSSSGSWILYVTDNQAGDSGTLTGWSLNLDVVPEPTNVALGIFGGLLAVAGLARSKRVQAFFRRKMTV